MSRKLLLASATLAAVVMPRQAVATSLSATTVPGIVVEVTAPAEGAPPSPPTVTVRNETGRPIIGIRWASKTVERGRRRSGGIMPYRALEWRPLLPGESRPFQIHSASIDTRNHVGVLYADGETGGDTELAETMRREAEDFEKGLAEMREAAGGTGGGRLRRAEEYVGRLTTELSEQTVVGGVRLLTMPMERLSIAQALRLDAGQGVDALTSLNRLIEAVEARLSPERRGRQEPGQ